MIAICLTPIAAHTGVVPPTARQAHPQARPFIGKAMPATDLSLGRHSSRLDVAVRTHDKVVEEVFVQAQNAVRACELYGAAACEEQLTEIVTKVLENADPEDAAMWKAVELVDKVAHQKEKEEYCQKNPKAQDCTANFEEK